jgi:hypothetical protein
VLLKENKLFTTINPRSGFTKVATILTALAVMLSLGAFASPAPSLAAGETALLMRVRVTNYQHGNNLQGAVVHAIGTSATEQYNAVTGSDGIALLKVPIGLYQVTVQVPSFQPLYEPWSQTVKMGIAPSTTIGARLLFIPELYPLKIQVLDSVSMAGVPNANVRVYDKYGQTLTQGITSATGTFIGRAPAGTFSAAVMHPKFEAHQDFVQLFAGQGNATIVGLAPLYNHTLGDMQIHAIDASTKTPIKGASVTLTAPSGKVIDQGMTDATGVYYTCLPEGPYTVKVTAPKYSGNTAVYKLIAGTLYHYDVMLVPIMPK